MTQDALPRLALAVFVSQTECVWLNRLRPGFRHCFVALRDGATWLICDPLKDRIELSVVPAPHGFDLGSFYARRGDTVLLGTTAPNLARRRFAIAPLTCVTIAKRLLGVDAPWVLTPWQLYRVLKGDAHRFLTVRPTPVTREEHLPHGSQSVLDTPV